ncbi:unnamed protein product [Heligmosomoides polygyrus]|uniref:non-specific serine/threonine protein kinase n=1 Tax=Heligmosomoides polygyrus TaxID=6339 RepID=A0A3P8BT67_HELPZ|nr:unnamed protein product [Heligmosomoides polygyrus]
MKAEPNDVEGGSAIKLEIAILRSVTESGEKPHIPCVFHAAKHKKYCYMVMTLLGDNLKTLKVRRKLILDCEIFPQLSKRADVARHVESNRSAVLIQVGYVSLPPSRTRTMSKTLVFSVKIIHDYGYIHRDIKPNNFVMGHRDDLQRARLVHILDFGLARSYAAFVSGHFYPSYLQYKRASLCTETMDIGRFNYASGLCSDFRRLFRNQCFILPKEL